jgi:hypothetical protein
VEILQLGAARSARSARKINALEKLHGRLNTALGNIKSAIVGTCRSFDSQHTERYLAAYEWRFNRRFDLAKNIERLVRVAVATSPAPYRSIARVRPAAEMPG